MRFDDDEVAPPANKSVEFERSCSHAASALKLVCEECAKLTPASVNASWFAALKGTVERSTVLDENQGLRFYTSTFSDVPPEGFKQGDTIWSANSPSTGYGVTGVGRTPAEAIAAFNKAMVEP